MPLRTSRHFRAGDEVVVRAPEEILLTLDAEGAMDGLPFMPEMVSYCGSRFRVARRLEKVCVENIWSQRRFPANDVVFLEELRCGGDRHDGCKRGCMIFWREAWLRRAKPGETPIRADEGELQLLLSHLKVKSDPAHYYCQSTQLETVTEPIPAKWKFGLMPQLLWVSLREIWVGNRSIIEVAGLMVHRAKLQLRKRRLGMKVALHSVPGPNKRTPTQSLELQPGEKVKMKSAPEVVATLDGESMNRGLRISVPLDEFCGREFVVRDRVDRIIIEATGEMRELKNTVTLHGVECICTDMIGSCPRADFLYWREIWLERSQASSLSDD